MKNWVIFAFISMFFAGFTSVIAKQGLIGISSELGLTIRTLFVCFFVLLFALFAVSTQEFAALNQKNLFWLGLSGITTALSWVYYYKALKLGNVSTIALIDKGSAVVAIVLAWLILKESITPRMLLGAACIVLGLVIIAKK